MRKNAPRRSLCELLLWHDIYDQYARSPDVAVRHADQSVNVFRRATWSWYMPSQIVKWHAWFA